MLRTVRTGDGGRAYISCRADRPEPLALQSPRDLPCPMARSLKLRHVRIGVARLSLKDMAIRPCQIIKNRLTKRARAVFRFFQSCSSSPKSPCSGSLPSPHLRHSPPPSPRSSPTMGASTSRPVTVWIVFCTSDHAPPPPKHPAQTKHCSRWKPCLSVPVSDERRCLLSR